MTIFRYFFTGWLRAAALWPVVLLLYLVDTGFAALLAAPPATQAATIFGRSVLAQELLGPVTLNILAELLTGSEGVAYPWFLYLVVPLVFLLATTFLRAGTIAALANPSAGFSWPAFLADCVRFFPRFLLLLLLLLPGLLISLLLFFGIHLLLGSLPLPLAPAILSRLAVLGFLLFLLLTALDYARISLVLDPRASVLRHAGRALRVMVRRFPAVVALGLAYALAGVAIAALYPSLLALSPIFLGLVPALLVQQTAAFLGSLQRVALLAGEMALFQDKAPANSLDLPLRTSI